MKNLHCQASENSTELAKVPNTLCKWIRGTSTKITIFAITIFAMTIFVITFVAPPILPWCMNSSLQL